MPAAPEITPAPIVPRQNDGSIDTCAFVNGNSNSPMTCPPSSTCTYGSFTNLMCCSGANCNSQYYACTDHGAYYNTFDTAVLSCPQSAPVCFQINIGTSEYDAPYLVACGLTSTVLTALPQPDPGLSGGTPMAIAATDPGQIQLGGAGVPITTTDSKGNVVVQPTGVSGGSSGGNSNSSSSNSMDRAQLIAAIVVPVIIFIFTVIFMWLFRNKFKAVYHNVVSSSPFSSHNNNNQPQNWNPNNQAGGYNYNNNNYGNGYSGYGGQQPSMGYGVQQPAGMGYSVQQQQQQYHPGTGQANELQGGWYGTQKT